MTGLGKRGGKSSSKSDRKSISESDRPCFVHCVLWAGLGEPGVRGVTCQRQVGRGTTRPPGGDG